MQQQQLYFVKIVYYFIVTAGARKLGDLRCERQTGYTAACTTKDT
jgi:hypothetical protein